VNDFNRGEYVAEKDRRAIAAAGNKAAPTNKVRAHYQAAILRLMAELLAESDRVLARFQ